MNQYPEGNFDFEDNIMSREALTNMFKAITELNLWNFLDNEPSKNNGYTFSSAPEIKKIEEHPLVEVSGHSGVSFGFFMRVMRNIRKNGWDNYVAHQLSLKNNLKTKIDVKEELKKETEEEEIKKKDEVEEITTNEITEKCETDQIYKVNI